LNPFYVVGYRILRAWWWLTRPYVLGVRVLVIRDGAVLLVKHSYRRNWYLPGGGPERGETLEAAGRREVQEETGTLLGEVKLHGVFTGFMEGCTDHVVVYVSEQVLDFDFRPSREIVEARFFALDALPEGTSPATRRRIEEHRAGTRGIAGAW